jgi:hypothetical protein
LELGYEEFTALFTRFDQEAVHLEMRDSYGTAVELPHMARWAAGEPRADQAVPQLRALEYSRIAPDSGVLSREHGLLVTASEAA